MFFDFYSHGFTALPAPDISVYAAHCIKRKRHSKRRMRQYKRGRN
nr:MAG TPA: hypothetical protein [Caudoviricetes sp.]